MRPQVVAGHHGFATAQEVALSASLRDVAAAAGVSVKTVSNVVNNYPFVSAETR